MKHFKLRIFNGMSMQIYSKNPGISRSIDKYNINKQL